MSKKIIYILSVLVLFSSCVSEEYKRSRAEREAIGRGNKNYEQKNYSEAAGDYSSALDVNSGSLAANFNHALADARIGMSLEDSLKMEMLDRSVSEFDTISSLRPSSPEASKAFYNSGNLRFHQQKIEESIDYYKKALRINPADSVAKRNLRIAQLNLPPKDKNQQDQQNQNDQNQDNKDQDQNQDNQQNQKDQQQKQQQDQQQQQPQQQPQQPQQQKPQQQPQQLNQGASDRILQRSQSKENELRSKLYRNANPRRNTNSKKW